MPKKKKINKDRTSKNKKNSKINLVIWSLAALVVIILAYLFLFDKEERTYMSGDNTLTTAYEFIKQGEVSFVSPDGKFKAGIDAEIAETEFKRNQGLMYRTDLRENQGMLFIFPFEQPLSFWMRNTTLPLDIIFVNASNEIVKIHRNTTPYSTQSYPSGEPAKYVVEVNSGFTEKYNINEGDRIVWRRL